MAFGIGIGLKDGVGKASEFFAGCVGALLMICISSFSSEGDLFFQLFQLFIGAKLVSGQLVCFCSRLQVLQSATHVSGNQLYAHDLVLGDHIVI